MKSQKPIWFSSLHLWQITFASFWNSEQEVRTSDLGSWVLWALPRKKLLGKLPPRAELEALGISTEGCSPWKWVSESGTFILGLRIEVAGGIWEGICWGLKEAECLEIHKSHWHIIIEIGYILGTICTQWKEFRDSSWLSYRATGISKLSLEFNTYLKFNSAHFIEYYCFQNSV